MRWRSVAKRCLRRDVGMFHECFLTKCCINPEANCTTRQYSVLRGSPCLCCFCLKPRGPCTIYISIGSVVWALSMYSRCRPCSRIHCLVHDLEFELWFVLDLPSDDVALAIAPGLCSVHDLESKWCCVHDLDNDALAITLKYVCQGCRRCYSLGQFGDHGLSFLAI